MNEKAKTTISIKAPVYEAGLKLAAAEERDFSFIVERALVGELRTAGVELGSSPTDEFVAKVTTALEADPAVKPEIERVLRKLERKKREGRAPVPA